MNPDSRSAVVSVFCPYLSQPQNLASMCSYPTPVQPLTSLALWSRHPACKARWRW
jgi:hypothetical protein